MMGLQRVSSKLWKSEGSVQRACEPSVLLCALESTDCCMARLLSCQDDFANQVSMLEHLIVKARHKCIFLPKFHSKLNPTKMVCNHVTIACVDLTLSITTFH